MSRQRRVIDCAVVGAGPAGLAASAAPSARGVEHVVLERGRVGESWRTQRWDSFRLDKLAADCPVREGAPVARLATAGEGYAQRIGGGDILARTVVVASGDQNLPKIPALASTVPRRVAQFHTADYRGPHQLPEGAVLVVGSAQSGCQITEDLLAGDRRVVLATAPVGRVPCWYRGRDTGEWLVEAGFMDQRPGDLPDPSVMHRSVRCPRVPPPARAPPVSSCGRSACGSTASLRPRSGPTWKPRRSTTRRGASCTANVVAGLASDLPYYSHADNP